VTPLISLSEAVIASGDNTSDGSMDLVMMSRTVQDEFGRTPASPSILSGPTSLLVLQPIVYFRPRPQGEDPTSGFFTSISDEKELLVWWRTRYHADNTDSFRRDRARKKMRTSS